MNTSSYNTLTKKLSYDVKEIDLLFEAMSLQMSFVENTIKNFYLLFVTWNLVRTLTKIEEKSCMECDIECDIDFDITKLESIAKGFNDIKEHQRVLGLPSPLIKLESVIIHKIENKIENYWIGSNKEIKDLALSISNKINSKVNAI